MWSVEPVSQNIQLFFDENWPEIYFWRKLSKHAAQVDGVLSINAKVLAFQSLL